MDNPINNSKITGKDPVTGKFIEGNKFGKGRPPGSKNFYTDFEEAVKEIAEKNKISIEEAKRRLLKRAFTEADDGNFNFYKDIMDRYYGKPVQPIDFTTDDGVWNKLEELEKQIKNE